MFAIQMSVRNYCRNKPHSNVTELSVQSQTSSLQNPSSPPPSPAKFHQRTPQSSPSHTPAPPPQVLVPSLPPKDSSGEITAINMEEDSNTTPLQTVPLYAVPDKHRTKVRNYIIAH